MFYTSGISQCWYICAWCSSLTFDLFCISGWYMLHTKNEGHQISPSTLQSPTMTHASSICTLRFYYNIELNSRFRVSLSMKKKLKNKKKHSLNYISSVHFFLSSVFSDRYLDVVLRVGPRTTALSRISSSTNRKWLLSEVTVGSVPLDFNILFQVPGKLEDGEYFAIDDIDFISCFLPGKLFTQCVRLWEGWNREEKYSFFVFVLVFFIYL